MEAYLQSNKKQYHSKYDGFGIDGLNYFILIHIKIYFWIKNEISNGILQIAQPPFFFM